MVEKSQDKEMDKSVAVGNVENNSENAIPRENNGIYNYLQKLTYDLRGDFTTDRREIYRQEGEISISFCHFKVEFND